MSFRYSILAFLASLLFFTSCKTIKEPEYRGVESFKVNGIGADTSTLSLGLKYFNPNKYGMKMKDVEGDAYVDSTYLGHFYLDSAISIPNYSDFVLPVNLRVSMNGILSNALSVFAKKEFNIRLEGKCKVGKGGVFFPYPIRYEGKQALSLF